MRNDFLPRWRAGGMGTWFKQRLATRRMAYAQRMLESGSASIDVVAQAAGFGTALLPAAPSHHAAHLAVA